MRRRKPREDYVEFAPSQDAVRKAEAFGESFRRGEIGDAREVAAARARPRGVHQKKEAAYEKLQAKLPINFLVDVRPLPDGGWTAYVPYVGLEIEGQTEAAVLLQARAELEREMRIDPVRLLKLVEAGEVGEQRSITIGT